MKYLNIGCSLLLIIYIKQSILEYDGSKNREEKVAFK